MFSVETVSFLPKCQRDGRDLPCEREACHIGLHSLGQQSFVKVLQWSGTMTGAHGRTFEDLLHLVVVILVQATDLLRLFGTLQLAIHITMLSAYALRVGKDGVKLHGPVGEERPGIWRFHGTLGQFADVLALKLTEPLVADPSAPSVAQGTPIPVVNETCIEGVFDLALPMSLDARETPLAFWQRTLKEQLGLTLEPGEEPVEFFVVVHVERASSSPSPKG